MSSGGLDVKILFFPCMSTCSPPPLEAKPSPLHLAPLLEAPPPSPMMHEYTTKHSFSLDDTAKKLLCFSFLEPHPVVEPKVDEESIGDKKLTVSWSSPAEGELNGYRVEWYARERSSEEEKKDEKDGEKEEDEKEKEEKKEEGKSFNFISSSNLRVIYSDY